MLQRKWKPLSDDPEDACPPSDRALVFALEEPAFFSREPRGLDVYPAHPLRDTFREAKD